MPVDERIAVPVIAEDLRELRLALVCYGGVSLAIYMHGVTKELHKLVRASAAPADGPNPFPARTSEHAYWSLLRRVEGPGGARVRVVIDIIAGTSAGGINGICLAKALALNQSQDSLRQLWFEKGDINRLLAGGAWVPGWLKAPALVVGSALGAGTRAPLRGDEMCRWLYEAFAGMDGRRLEPGEPASLVPPDHSLELYVTVTDLTGYTRELPIADPRIIRDVTHRHVLVFRHDDRGESGFAAPYNHALAFAARATSSFPGAFPPVTFEDYEGYFEPRADLTSLGTRQFAEYAVNDVDPRRSSFVDGGVLDNAPFDHVLRAIRRRPAASQVDRRLLYIEPDPVASDGAAPAEAAEPDEVGWIKTVLASLSSVPAGQPILDDLNALAERNRLVRRIRDVIETNFGPIREHLESLAQQRGVALGALSSATPPATFTTLRADVAAAVVASAGFAHPSYVRLRLGFVLDGYAAMIASSLGYPLDSYPARFVESVVRDWAAAEGIDRNTRAAMPAQTAFLERTDLAYHERRLRFIIAAFSWWYRTLKPDSRPTRAELDAAKATLYQHIADLSSLVMKLAGTTEGRAALADAFPPAEVKTAARAQQTAEYLQHHRQHLDRLKALLQASVTRHVAALESELDATLARICEGWPADMRADLFARHLGFPLWDMIVYPIQALADVDERDQVDVVRMSPTDTKLLQAPAGGKLKGVGLHHFAAFFDRSYRENDYLWGRLDAAERLAGLLLDTPDTPTLDAPAAECRALFEAILAEEAEGLPAVASLVDNLRAQIARLA